MISVNNRQHTTFSDETEQRISEMEHFSIDILRAKD